MGDGWVRWKQKSEEDKIDLLLRLPGANYSKGKAGDVSRSSREIFEYLM